MSRYRWPPEGEVLTRNELAELVWGYQEASVGRTIDVHIRRLRMKLGSAHNAAPQIIAERGLGYRMASGNPTGNGSLADRGVNKAHSIRLPGQNDVDRCTQTWSG
jgi:DNA-binding winged helix-turn-helix (wHTH) protein